MPLFQNSVIPQYLKSQNSTLFSIKWEAFAKDKRIDAIVYKLNGLNNEEIEITENS